MGQRRETEDEETGNLGGGGGGCSVYKVLAQNSTPRVQELCESRGGRPGLSILMSLTVSVAVKQH